MLFAQFGFSLVTRDPAGVSNLVFALLHPTADESLVNAWRSFLVSYYPLRCRFDYALFLDT